MENGTEDAFANVRDEVLQFGLSDYIVFTLMVVISLVIGIYFGCFGEQQKTVKDYLLGGKTMKILPVGLSLVASGISGITLIGVPAEIYTTNAIYGLMIPSLIFACLFTSHFIMPIYFDLNITCIYEYLELRFNKSTRKIASILFTTSSFVYLPAVLYLPSLSLSQVTGINLHIITTGMTTICIFYTMIGGLKAVVWTDFIQTIITVCAFMAIVIIGTYNVGGLSYVLNTAYNDGKLDVFNMDPNPFQRNTFWTVTIGIMVSWTSGTACYQWSVQRFLSLPTVADARKTLIIFWVGISFLTGVSVYSGILTYVAYYGCDPIERKWVSRADQIFPYYVLDKVGYIPTLPGLFIAGVFSAALSTLSTSLNTLAGTLYEDFIRRNMKNDENAHIVMKALVLVIGAISVVMVLFIEKMGKILSASYMISGVLGAPIFSIFMMGMLIPKVNTKGALSGAFTAMTFLMWVSIGNISSNINHIQSDVYPIDTCLANSTRIDISTQNSTMTDGVNEADVFFLYKLSYLLYIPAGATIAIIIGVIVSYITGPTDLTTLDPRLISPAIRRFLPKKIVDECKRSQDEKLIEQSKGYL